MGLLGDRLLVDVDELLASKRRGNGRDDAHHHREGEDQDKRVLKGGPDEAGEEGPTRYRRRLARGEMG
jgi:hypothetical protein